MFASLYRPPAADREESPEALISLAREFSPRYECHGPALVSLDVSGLDRLLGPPAAIGEELRREATIRGIPVHVAIARIRSAAVMIALVRPGLTVVAPGCERECLAPLPVDVIMRAQGSGLRAQGLRAQGLRAQGLRAHSPKPPEPLALSLEPLKLWGIRTLGELAALPRAALSARLGQQALVWHAIARGEEAAPLVPTTPDERFEATTELEWPLEDLEPLSFVLTRLLEPLSARLERRDRGAAILHLTLRLVTKDEYARHLQLPAPLRDVRTLRTLLMLDLESNPPPAAIDRVTLLIDPTPGRVMQHTLFTRALPSPEQLSTLVARLAALMGQERIGAPALVDSHRPGAFAMTPFATEQKAVNSPPRPEIASALRRCRYPVPARAVVEDGRPIRLTTDRRGFPGGAVRVAAGPWRTSGAWWASAPLPWDRDEWDVALADGGIYRVFQDRVTNRWFIDAIVD